jgi:hypothetical protein
MALKAFLHCAIVRQARCRLVDYYDIEASKLCLVLPKRFANHSFNTVSSRCLAAVFFGYSQSEPCSVVPVGAGQYCK